MSRRLAAACLLAVAAAATVAVAHPRIHVARQVAAWRWGPVCGGHYEIRNAPLRGYLGYSSGCMVTLNSRHHFAWWDLCRVLTHEVGHLAGFRAKHPYVDENGYVDWVHSRFSHSLMFPFTREPYGPCGPDHSHPRVGQVGNHAAKLRPSRRDHRSAGQAAGASAHITPSSRVGCRASPRSCGGPSHQGGWACQEPGTSRNDALVPGLCCWRWDDPASSAPGSP